MYPLDEKRTMQANYPKKLPRPHWDRVHLEYPVRKFPGTGVSSETIGRKWADQPEVIMGKVNIVFKLISCLHLDVFLGVNVLSGPKINTEIQLHCTVGAVAG